MDISKHATLYICKCMCMHTCVFCGTNMPRTLYWSMWKWKSSTTRMNLSLWKFPLLDPDKLISYLIEAGLKIPQQQVEFFWSSKRANGEEWAIQSTATPKAHPYSNLWWCSQGYIQHKGSPSTWEFSFPSHCGDPGQHVLSRWCIFSLENAKLFGHHTLHPVLSRITYKLNMLFENGVVGSDGVTYKFACTEIRGGLGMA